MTMAELYFLRRRRLHDAHQTLGRQPRLIRIPRILARHLPWRKTDQWIGFAAQ